LIKLGNCTFFKKSSDGGKDSGVTGFWLIEWKPVFSIVLLKFTPNTRENFHSHAFNALTWWLKGKVREQIVLTDDKIVLDLDWKPSFWPKFTPKENTHKIIVKGRSAWALSIRGGREKTWKEYNLGQGREITLTKGRKILADTWV
jgi:hypothetical protein